VFRRLLLLAAAAAWLASPAPAIAQGSAQGSRRPTGFTVSVDLGGGGQLGAGSAYSPETLLELEATAGYYVGLGLSPELSLLLGMSPGAYFAMRPGLHWAIPETPFYLRGAVDFSTQTGVFKGRWILLGGGFELRLTDVVGFFAEGDTGIPIADGAGVPMMVRAGAYFSF
jgi:hypothetical protein